MSAFTDLKREVLGQAIAEHLGVEVWHWPKAGGGQAEGLALSIVSRPELDEDGERWKYATGAVAQFDVLPLKGDVIEEAGTGVRYIVNRAVDNGGVLELRLEVTTK